MRISWMKVERALRESGLSDSETMRELRGMKAHMRVVRDVERRLIPFIVRASSAWYYTDKLCLSMISARPSETHPKKELGRWNVSPWDPGRGPSGRPLQEPAKMELWVDIEPKAHLMPAPKGYTTPWAYEHRGHWVITCRKLY